MPSDPVSCWAFARPESVSCEGDRWTVAPHVSIIGGAEIYRLFLPHADRIELTEVHLKAKGDTRLDPFGPDWAEVARTSHMAEGERPAFDFVTLKRRG